MCVPNKFSQEEYSCQRITVTQTTQITQTILQKTLTATHIHLMQMNRARTKTLTRILQAIQHLTTARILQATQHLTAARIATTART